MYTRKFIHDFREAARDAAVPNLHELLLHHLTTFCNSEGGNAHPSQTTLARTLGKSDRTVRTLLKHLQGAGWVELVKRGHSGGDGRSTRAANVYQLHIGVPFTVVRGEVRRHDDAERNDESVPAVDSECDPEVTASDAVSAPVSPPPAPEVPAEDADEYNDGWTPSHS